MKRKKIKLDIDREKIIVRRKDSKNNKKCRYCRGCGSDENKMQHSRTRARHVTAILAGYNTDTHHSARLVVHCTTTARYCRSPPLCRCCCCCCCTPTCFADISSPSRPSRPRCSPSDSTIIIIFSYRYTGVLLFSYFSIVNDELGFYSFPCRGEIERRVRDVPIAERRS